MTEHVAGLHVAMDDIAGVGRFQALGHLDGDVDGFVKRQTFANFLRERLALVKGHHDEGAAVGGFFHAVNHADVGVIERGGGAGFLEELLFFFCAGVDFQRQEFQSDGALQLEVARFVDNAHPSGAGHGHNFVMGNPVSGI